MRKSLRGVVVAAVLAPAVVLSVGIASADTYSQHSQQAGPNGASSSHVMSGTTAGGGSYYSQGSSMAGPDGAMSSWTQSTAGGTGGRMAGGGLLGLGWLLG
ncbi:hypothetical protein [Streptomyces sp. NPDC086787]|uniref:hypothetical protein n=1 Tax=Streptomyces sp. NPDC086787 TaxID=3365759 RepID=UPI003801CDB1